MQRQASVSHSIYCGSKIISDSPCGSGGFPEPQTLMPGAGNTRCQACHHDIVYSISRNLSIVLSALFPCSYFHAHLPVFIFLRIYFCVCTFAYIFLHTYIRANISASRIAYIFPRTVFPQAIFLNCRFHRFSASIP